MTKTQVTAVRVHMMAMASEALPPIAIVMVVCRIRRWEQREREVRKTAPRKRLSDLRSRLAWRAWRVQKKKKKGVEM
jgi:hypothetical protein